MRWPAGEDFWLGANLPWLRYGCDFGANRWQPEGGVARPETRADLTANLARLADCGASVVRWFMLADGRAGLEETASGDLIGLDRFVLRDADAAVEELDRAGLRAVFVLFDFHWFTRARRVNAVRLGGRRQLAADPGSRPRLLDRVVAPLLDRYGRHPSILAWDVLNEPDWVTRRLARLSRRGEVPRADMRAFLREVVGLIHERTVHAATVGCASAQSLRLVQDIGLDLYQVHWYDHLEPHAPLDRPVSSFGLDRPVILGEYPTRGSRLTPSEIVAAARLAGYAGALGWSALAADEASDGAALAAELAGFAARTARIRARP